MTRTKVGAAVFIYAALLSILGYLGYRSGSQISGYLGVGFGTLLAGCSLLIFIGRRTGIYAASLFTAILTAVFFARYAATGKVLTIALAILSAVTLLFLFVEILRGRKS